MSSRRGLRTHICSALGAFAGPASALWPAVPLDGRKDEIMKIGDEDDKAEMAAVLSEGRAQSGLDKQIRNDICLLGLITTSVPVKLTERGRTDYVNVQRRTTTPAQTLHAGRISCHDNKRDRIQTEVDAPFTQNPSRSAAAYQRRSQTAVPPLQIKPM
ncbi:hypothetical protein ROHU_012204 [Labeo rohita]|uniref:Uncharacterized protein n=1 Tax=Labeo rohita TaxID=84645 RepID=A0A498LHB1_LABRO|nr:hypothetical protein ROHU_012204 [Labeo rohita]